MEVLLVDLVRRFEEGELRHGIIDLVLGGVPSLQSELTLGGVGSEGLVGDVGSLLALKVAKPSRLGTTWKLRKPERVESSSALSRRAVT